MTLGITEFREKQSNTDERTVTHTNKDKVMPSLSLRYPTES